MAVSVSVTAEMLMDYMQRTQPDRRGINVYNLSELQGVVGKDKSGKLLQGAIQRPMFALTLNERIDIFRFAAPIFGVVSSRMGRISGLEWNVISEKKDEDRIITRLQNWKAIYDEYTDEKEIPAQVITGMLSKEIRKTLIDAKPDLSNFSTSLMRWRRRIKESQEDRATEIEDWMQEPNLDDNFIDFVKKEVFDLMVHGNISIFKEESGGRVENFYMLPGGTTFQFRSPFVGGGSSFIQMLDTMQPQVFFTDEISYTNWIPTSAQSWGMVPLEALINKIAEQLLFDKLAAERADGTKPPEKMVIFGETSPFGDLDKEMSVPMEEAEQKKIETIINEARKEAVRTLSGVGTPLVLDLSRADTFTQHQERYRSIKEDIALVFNMSNLEMNLTGSADTSGRATSESQERQDLRRGVFPIIDLIETIFNKDIIPFRFGGIGFKFKFKSGMSEAEEVEMITKKLLSGAWALNEVRTEDMGKDPFPEPEHDRPKGTMVQQPDGTEKNPLFTQLLGGK